MTTVACEVFHPERILSASNAPRMMIWLQNCLETGYTNLLIDLSYVMFMDSSGLGALVTALKRVQEAGGNLALCSLSGQARMLFDIANISDIFDIYASQEDFIQSLASEQPTSTTPNTLSSSAGA